MSVRDEWNMACPNCGDDEDLHIVFTGECRLFPDGTEDDGDHEWEGKSACRCGICDWTGTVADARATVDAEDDLPGHCTIEDHEDGDGYRYRFDGDDDDAPRKYPTWIEAVRAASLIG